MVPAMNRSAVLLLAAIILIWGANWPILKVGLLYIPPLWLGLIRLVLAAVLLTVVAKAAERRLRWPPRADWPVVISVGILQMAAFTAFMNLGLQYVDAGRSAILAYTTPLWVAPGAVVLLREPLGRMGGLGVIVGLVGVAVMFDPTSFDWSDGDAVTGNALLLAAAAAWAISILHTRGHRWSSSSLALAPWQMLVGIVTLLPLALIFEGAPAIEWNATSIFVIVYNAVLASAFGFWAVITVTRALPAVTSSLAFLGVPICGLLLSAWWLGEAMDANKLLALALVIAGVAAVTLRRRAA